MSTVLIAMCRADGEIDSEIHFAGHVIKPDANGVVRIPSEFVLSMWQAGYIHVAYMQPEN
jgi:hypothetical protein